ncbi:TetR family transcriptional regulator [Paraconexibacter algicola]|uniref:TetR family transcriptional regulator n=2 Tax=Paraconexibacter algicola TaxID=2133960 RepID=A0A2T4UFH6_9ACTN|nr:TetR family transcriptional regulator [Paraconexibacter algicola]
MSMSGASDPAPTKHAARSAATRSALIAAGRELFATRGYAEVGTEEIVRTAGVTRGALYHQFADKRELFAAVYEEIEAELTAQLAPGALEAARTGDPLDALGAAARAFFAGVRDPAVERIALVDAPAVLGWDRWRAIGLAHGLGLTETVLQAAIDAGVLAPQPTRPLAHVLLGALDEAALYVARAADPDAAATEAIAVVDALIAGLRRPA